MTADPQSWGWLRKNRATHNGQFKPGPAFLTTKSAPGVVPKWKTRHKNRFHVGTAAVTHSGKRQGAPSAQPVGHEWRPLRSWGGAHPLHTVDQYSTLQRFCSRRGGLPTHPPPTHPVASDQVIASMVFAYLLKNTWQHTIAYGPPRGVPF